MSSRDKHGYTGLRWVLATYALVLIAIAFIVAMCSAPADAAEAPATDAVTFGASVTNANGSLSTKLTWDAPGATGCAAAGHASWTGSKPASGSLDLPAITLSGTYQLTLTCSFPGDRSARVSWTAPTKNTDGTALTNLAGFRVLYGTSPAALTQVVQVPSATATSQLVDSLALGTWHFAAKAYNSAGVESAVSNVVSKTIVASTSKSASVSLTVNPVPAAPVASVE